MFSPFLEYFFGIIAPAAKAGLLRLKLTGVGGGVGSRVWVGSSGGGARVLVAVGRGIFVSAGLS
jgi:hypothetical protein